MFYKNIYRCSTIDIRKYDKFVNPKSLEEIRIINLRVPVLLLDDSDYTTAESTECIYF